MCEFAFQRDVLVMQGSERKAEWPGTKNTLNDARLGSASFMLIFLNHLSNARADAKSSPR